VSVPAAFEELLVTRGTEIDGTATVPPQVFLRYFEHLRWSLMQEPALGLLDLIHDSHFFVVREQRLELRRRVGMGTALRLRTRLDRCGRSTADVVHEAVRQDDGALVARARVTGVWLNGDRRVARIPDAYRAFSALQAAAAGASEPDDAPSVPASPAPWPERDRPGHARSFIAPLSWAFPARGLEVDLPREAPPSALHTHRLRVAPRDLDVFGHVNAATWLAFAEDARADADAAGALPQDCTGPRWLPRVALFYGREATVGQTLAISLWQPEVGALAYAVTDDASGTFLGAVRCDHAPGWRSLTAPSPGSAAGPAAMPPHARSGGTLA
jgi:acyl-CoA thioesterase FadM